jgi:hypothetical protein
MLRAFGAFLLLFWLLSLVVQLHGTVVYLLGASALVVFAIDLLAPFLTTPARGRMRGEPLL